MLSLSAAAQDQVIPLPEPSESIALFLKVITGKAGEAHTWKSDFNQSLQLYNMLRKYNTESSFRSWGSTLLMRFVTPENALECFAVACEDTPTDLWLVKQALVQFPSGAVPCDTDYGGLLHYMEGHLCRYPDFAGPTNPATWSKDYVTRLGLGNFWIYVRAWDATYIQPWSRNKDKSSKDLLKELMQRFCSELETL
jgi:hypothetical protein